MSLCARSVIMLAFLPVKLALQYEKIHAMHNSTSAPIMNQFNEAVEEVGSTCDPASVLSARIVNVGDSNYDQCRSQWASDMSTVAVSDSKLSPELIVYCDTDNHVVEAVSFAKQCGYKVSVRSGGHQYAGLSSCSVGTKCLQLDLSAMESFVHTPGTSQVILGVGLTIEQVHSQLVPLGLTIPMGICKSVGVGGHFQSSGKGFLGRSFGLGMDHVTSFRIVLQDASIQTVNATSHGDLYWAVLGGSPGSWGVVLDYTIDALRFTDYPHTQMMLYTWPYSHDLFVNITNEYMAIMKDPALARDLVLLLVVQPITPIASGNFNHYIFLQGLWTGIDNGALTDELFAKYMQPLIDFQAPLPPPFQGANVKLPLHIIASTLIVDFNNQPFRYHVHSVSSNQFFDEGFVEKAATEIDERLAISGMYSSFQFQPFGGTGDGSQVNRNAGMNAYPVRDIGMHVDDWVFFENDDQAWIAQNRIENFRRSTESYWRADGSAESSWMTTSTMSDNHHLDRFEDYFPSQDYFHKLQVIKTSIDPEDLFSSAMTIPPLPGAPTPAPTTDAVRGFADPHMVNVLGEHFNIWHLGRVELLRIPRNSSESAARLRFVAEVSESGTDSGNGCTKAPYMTAMRLSGSYFGTRELFFKMTAGNMNVFLGAESLKPSMKPVSIDGDLNISRPSEGRVTVQVGNATINVTHDNFKRHFYLNMEAHNLGSLGFEIGGVLGLDDHTFIAHRPAHCQQNFLAEAAEHYGGFHMSASVFG